MEFQYSPYMLPLIGAALLSGWIAAYAWKRRSTRSASALALLALAIMIWSLGYALEIASTELAAKLFWGKVQYIGIATAPLFWFIFAYNHAQRDKPMPRRTMLLWWGVCSLRWARPGRWKRNCWTRSPVWRAPARRSCT